MKILAINPGGTSTKIAVFENEKELINVNVMHSEEEINSFSSVTAQKDLRNKAILLTLEEHGQSLNSLDAVVGRGGLLKPLPGGTYTVNSEMINDLHNAINGEHPSNLGPILADEIASSLGISAFIVDPVSVDEFDEQARLSGLREIDRASWLHALNHKAVCRQVAKELGGKYEDYGFIVAHLGSGISIAAHRQGRMVDGSGGRSNGPFSPERCGSIPAYALVNLCFSGKYNYEEIVQKISTKAGFFDYLGTKNLEEVEARYVAGDKDATVVLDAFVYQVAKEIASYSVSLNGKVDSIILTGGIAHSKFIMKAITNRIHWMAEVKILPGEMEMQALATGALRVLKGIEKPLLY